MENLSPIMIGIKNQILDEKIKVVSFDMFDTLVFRPCITPANMFKIVARRSGYTNEFVITRQMAEKQARKIKPFFEDDITIDDIYKEFQVLTGTSKEMSDKLKMCEMSVEFEYIYPRRAVKALYDAAVDAGKNVIITTDIYLPKEFIVSVLKKNGYLSYDEVYVSSNEKMSKGSGRIYEKIIAHYSQNGISAERIIHLGDNKRADVDMPKKYNMQSVYLPSASGVFNSKVRFKAMIKYGMMTDNCFLIGTLANYLFDDPYHPHNINTVSGGNAANLGIVLYGPLLLLYVKWIVEQSIKDKIQNLFFVYRDGYLPGKIFALMKPLYGVNIATDRIYLSRQIRYYFYAKNNCGLINSMDKFGIPPAMTVREFIEKRLLLTDKDEMQKVWEIFLKNGYESIDSPVGDKFNYYYFLHELDQLFRKKAEEKISVIEEYCRMHFNGKENNGIIDIGYSGSVGKFLSEYLSIPSKTYQFLSIPTCNRSVEEKYDIFSFYKYGYQFREKLMILHQLSEDIISVQEGSAYSIDKMGDKFIVRKEPFHNYNETLAAMQEGIIDFISYVTEHLKFDFCQFDFDKELFWNFMTENLDKPHETDAQIIKSLYFCESNFIKISDSNIYETWYNQKVKKTVELSGTEKKKKDEADNSNENMTTPWNEISRFHLLAIKICERLHIINQAIAIKAWIKKLLYENKKIREDVFERTNITSLNHLEEAGGKLGSRKRILIAGHMASFDKGICNFINELSRVLDKEELFFLSEANEHGTREKMRIVTSMVPDYLLKDTYKKSTKVKVTGAAKKYVLKHDYLRWGVENLLSRYEDMEENYAYMWAFYADDFIRKMLGIIKPEKVILWNEFSAYHHILKYVCEEMQIDIYYMEFGSLPGTISLEHIGQMGRSFPGIYYEEFRDLPVNEFDNQVSKNVLEYLYKSRINRNIQPVSNEIDIIKEKIKKGRPVILYAGVNDFESGLIPYTKETELYHSPCYKSSDEVIDDLADIAKANEWNLIYKPHPLVANIKRHKYEEIDHIIMAGKVDINDIIDMSDVVITILSQVSYISLIRKTPVVMLGYTQLRGKRCCYEAFSKGSLERTVKNAITDGFTREQQKYFQKHVAQMLKYNLYDDLTVKPISYGMPIRDFARFLHTCDDSLKWYLENSTSFNL